MVKQVGICVYLLEKEYHITWDVNTFIGKVARWNAILYVGVISFTSALYDGLVNISNRIVN